MSRLPVACLLGLAACGTSIDPAGLPSIDGFQSWYTEAPRDSDIPGHPHSVRVIHVNDVGRTYPHFGRYPLGTVIVKEIFERNDDGSPGDLRYLAIMRKLGDDSGEPTNDGWLFTEKPSATSGGETQKDSCWQTCHKAAPRDGTWYDHGE